MKVLTAKQMGEIDRLTAEAGVPDIVLMENAGHRVAELIQEKFAPLTSQRVVVFSGKGNNGGDGFVVARQLYTRLRPKSLHVVFQGDPAGLKGSAATNYHALTGVGCKVFSEITPEMRQATLVVDALLGTGLSGAARGTALELIREINTGFPLARVVALDIPSGLSSDTGAILGEAARADYTVTFTAPKIGHALPPACNAMGEIRIGEIGSPPSLYEDNDEIFLAISGPRRFGGLFAPRDRGAHKGSYGHVLVVGGARGKTGAAAMAGLSALRAGAGLVTVASAESAIPTIAGHAAEIMTEPLPETDAGSISPKSFDYGRIADVARDKTVLAVGPGLGTHPETVDFLRRLLAESTLPVVLDADGLNALAGTQFTGRPSMVFTPHPGEMSRLTGLPTKEILADRVGVARGFSMDKNLILVLKGQRSLVATPDGHVWINPTGSPAMATGGSGDILTGLIAGLISQFPDRVEDATLAAVWLHGRAGELGAAEAGEQFLIATDLLQYLPDATEDARNGLELL